MRSLKSHATALAFLLTGLIASPGHALDRVYIESGDTGALPATAQGIGDANVIDGTLADESGEPETTDVDLYEVCLTGGHTFSASTYPDDGGQFSEFNPSLALFDSEGRGVYFNNNFYSGSSAAKLPAGDPLTPAAAGKYYLAITAYGNYGYGEGRTLLLSPNGGFGDVGGPLSTLPLVSWGDSGFAFANPAPYRIRLTGVTACPSLTVSDFLPPIDPGAVNDIKAGGVVAVKWLLTDADGNPVDDPSSFVSITTDPGGGICDGLSSVTVETWPGNSGLQYLGDGVWQFNWKVPKDYAGQCRLMTLTLSDGTEASAIFEFK